MITIQSPKESDSSAEYKLQVNTEDNRMVQYPVPYGMLPQQPPATEGYNKDERSPSVASMVSRTRDQKLAQIYKVRTHTYDATQECEHIPDPLLTPL